MTTTMPDYTVRTSEELAAKVAELWDSPSSPFGFGAEVLIPELPLDQAAPYLKEEALARYRAGEEIWHGGDLDPVRIRREAIEYLEFAYGKAMDHRGISAFRSIEKLAAYCWLLGAPWDLVAGAPHANYGAPGLMAAAGFLDHPFPFDGPLAEMAEGRPCSPDCVEGCGR